MPFKGTYDVGFDLVSFCMVTGFKTAAAHTAVTAVIRYRGTIDFGRLIYAAVTLGWTDLHEVSSILDD